MRRKTSSLSGFIYVVEFASALQDGVAGSWSPAAGLETVTSIDTNWERVVVEDTETVGSADMRFGRVKLTFAP